VGQLSERFCLDAAGKTSREVSALRDERALEHSRARLFTFSDTAAGRLRLKRWPACYP